MTKILTYLSIAIGAILIIILFVTSKSYLQLTAAIILYPLFTFVALKLLPRKTEVYIAPTLNSAYTPNATANVVLPGKVDIVDIEKRTFLKLVGTAGLSFFIFSLLGRKAEDLLFNKPNSTITPNLNDKKSASSSEYKISEIDDGVISFYGFVNENGNWYIMREDSSENSFRYSKGEDNFSANWQNREKLRYDYYDSLF